MEVGEDMEPDGEEEWEVGEDMELELDGEVDLEDGEVMEPDGEEEQEDTVDILMVRMLEDLGGDNLQQPELTKSTIVLMKKNVLKINDKVLLAKDFE